MKKVILMVTTALFIASCTKNQKTESGKTETQAQVEIANKPQVQENALNKSKESKSSQEDQVLVWHGASSRNDLQKKLKGTTWETTAPDGYMGLFHKFVISGNGVQEYSAKPPKNYDDPKDWHESTNWDIHSINEPEQGLYIVALKGKEGTGVFEDTPVFLVFKGELCFYSFAGDDDSNTPIKLISSEK